MNQASKVVPKTQTCRPCNKALCSAKLAKAQSKTLPELMPISVKLTTVSGWAHSCKKRRQA